MKLNRVKKIADAVLYEGYILYPYRASAVKNRQRFHFGALLPEAYCLARGGESSRMQTECLVLGDAGTLIEVKARFLHLLSREVWQATGGADPADRRPWRAVGQMSTGVSAAGFRAVEGLEIDGRFWQTWQEAVEREADVEAITLGELLEGPQEYRFRFPARQETEVLRDAGGKLAGALVRRQEAVDVAIELRAVDCGLRIDKETFTHLGDDNLQSAIGSPHLYRLTARILNLTELTQAQTCSRDQALGFALASTHTILGVRGGEFVSLLEPAAEFARAAAACAQIGTFPVLVGEAGERDLLLSSPIILYDYPQVAPESAGDLFDGAEIDEILMLRILTLTDEEKREMRSVDVRARQILERSESLPAEQFMRLHGAMRGKADG